MAKRLNPASSDPIQLAGVNVRGYTIGSWCPTPDGTGPAIAVAISIETEAFGDIVLRIKSPQAVDEFIQALLRHKRDVWPNSH